MSIRVAIITDMYGVRHNLEKEFSRIEGYEVVFIGANPGKRTKELLRSKPDIVLMTSGGHTFRSDDLIIGLPRFVKNLERKSPQTKLLLYSDLPQSHGLIKTAMELSVSVIDRSFDALRVAKEMRSIIEGKPVTLFPQKGGRPEFY